MTSHDDKDDISADDRSAHRSPPPSTGRSTENPFARRLDLETDCADVRHQQLDGDPHLVLIDARSADDYAARHIPGAISMPYPTITSTVLAEFAPSSEFVTYCWGPHCNGATRAAAAISQLGRPVREMLGGMWGWQQEGFRFAGTEVGVRIGLLCFDGMDMLDVGGPYEVLLTANRLRIRDGAAPPFEVRTIGDTSTSGRPRACAVYGGLAVTPEWTVAEIDYLDVLIVPGAIDIENARPDPALHRLAPRADVLASVCTGAFLLQRNGLLTAAEVTTHWEDADALEHPNVTTSRRWVDAGDVVTSGGISSGIAMALHLVERFADRALADATARQIDYAWAEARP